MSKEDNQKFVGMLFNAIGGLSGLSAIAMMFIWGGRMDNRVTHVEKQATKLEVEGSPVTQVKLAKMETRQDEQERTEADTQRRLDKVETLETTMAKMSGQLDVITTKLDMMNDRLKKVEK